MGILNVTPDSFYAPSRRAGFGDAIILGRQLAEDGADILDVGGESTRPGSGEISGEEEARRVLPVIEALAKECGIPISVDTNKPFVAERALDSGAFMLNDTLALRGDARMPEIAARYRGVVLMHMQGRPRTMQDAPRYSDVIGEIIDFFADRLRVFAEAGGDAARVWLDPGLGFGKTLEHNLCIMRRLEEFQSLEMPILIGASRKSFIGRVLGTESEPVAESLRLEGSLASAARAAAAGAACVRVHDVAETRRFLDVWAAVKGAAP